MGLNVFVLIIKTMIAYSKKSALPFEAYCKFIQELGKIDKQIYDYIRELGFSIGSEEEYKNAISRSEIDKQNDFSMKHWDRMAGKVKWNNIATIDTYCSQLKFVGNSVIKNGVILDMGCGNGDTTEWIRRNTQAEVIGIDYSRNMINEHKRFNNPRLILGDCEVLPIKDGSINQVFLNWFISNSDRDKVLDEAIRVLAPKGEVRLTTTYAPRGFCCVDAKTYDEFLIIYMEKHYGTERFQNLMNDAMEFRDCSDKAVQNEIFRVAERRLDVSYEFSRFPLVPRGAPRLFEFHVPIAIVGRKVKS